MIDGERIALREKILERLWDDANYGDKKILTFDQSRYGNVFIDFGDGTPVSIPLFCLAERMVDDEELRNQYMDISDSVREKL